MSNRLSSIGSLNYQGTNATNPPNIIVRTNAPTQNDTQNVSLGDFWIHRKSNTANDSDLYVLMGLAGGIADWDLISGNQGTVISLTGNDSIQVFPTNGNINVVGDATTIEITGNVSASTLTASLISPVFKTTNMQVFTTSGTYTPTTNMQYCIIEVVGGGGGGGGAVDGANCGAAGGGGGAGGYARGIFSASSIGTSQSITIGAGGSAGTSGSGDGGSGGTTSVGSGPLIQASGGSGGFHGDAQQVFATGNPGSGGAGSLGSLNSNGAPGSAGIAAGNTINGYLSIGGTGGSSIFGGGAKGAVGASSGAHADGSNANNYGSGGSGGISTNSGGNASGGAGSAGIVIITEFIS